MTEPGLAICTLFEGDHHVGAGALLNSVARSGHGGPVVLGHRGEPPPWFPTAQEMLPNRLLSVPIESDRHLAYLKPWILRRAMDETGADAVAYADPDVVVKCPAEVLQRWCRDGLALVQDVNNPLPDRHPYRLRWRDHLADLGYDDCRPLDVQYNSGFVGLPRDLVGLLDLWQQMIDAVIAHNDRADVIKVGDANALFHSTDQDALNMALMVSEAPINDAGPDGMDFDRTGLLLSHAIGTPKPWQTTPLRRAISGHAPSAAHRAFWEYVGEPVPVLEPRRVGRARRALRAQSALTRFYRRT